VVSNPEFLKEGAAIDDFMRPDRIVVGCEDEQAALNMRALYAPIQRHHDRLIVMDIRSEPRITFAANQTAALEGADALIIVAEWREWRES
jgi:UDPglucose 6-dehydrogenase